MRRKVRLMYMHTGIEAPKVYGMCVRAPAFGQAQCEIDRMCPTSAGPLSGAHGLPFCSPGM